MPDGSTPPSVPGYDFVRMLGSGSTASVYLYHQQVPDRDVAIKVSRSTLDETSAERFRNEANFMAQISAHPHILSVHSAGVTNNGLGYIVLEYAPGGSYKELIQARPLSTDQMLDLGIKLAGALYTAHRKGILHRDIKPGNILITAQGLPVLADFGIATTVYESRSRTGFSIPWAPPEVLTGTGGGNETADIYSLGATLFATIAGKSPFEYGYRPRNRNDLARIIVEENTPHLDRGDVPKDVERILLRALSKNPDARYGSALEFARAMQRAQQRCFGHVTPVTVEGTSPLPADLEHHSQPQYPVAQVGGQRRPWSWKKPAAVTAAICAAAALVAAAFVFVIWPNLDSSNGADRARIAAPGTSSSADETPQDDDAFASSRIPAPDNLVGTYSGSTVTFTWTNPEPAQGDTYAWAPVDQNDATSSVQTQIVTQPSVTLKNITDAQTCIQVSIVRQNRQMSQSPATVCAVRR